jgi:hypothetical protein
MIDKGSDIDVLRELARRQAEIAALPGEQHKRQLWAQNNSLKPTRPLMLATYGMWNVWCREYFGDHAMKCQDPFLREQERVMRMKIFSHTIGDDSIVEPWHDIMASQPYQWNGLWGVHPEHVKSGAEGGAWRFDSPIKEWADVKKLTAPGHVIDEAKTKANLERLSEAFGDILPINVQRGAICQLFQSDLSYDVTQLRGLEQVMIDMYESPEQLHELMAFLRDGRLANEAQAEAAGDFGLTDQGNQSMTYATELPAPKANCYGQSRKNLWTHIAAQEMTLVSPQMHDEFILRYQLPIMSNYGLCQYGCCEDLTNKIDMLRKIPNLRIIAVAPLANVRRCAEQIGKDYVISWRPNPTDMVCCGFDEDRIRRQIREGLSAMKGCHVQIHLKDIETVEGDYDRLAKWTRIVRECI